MILSELIAKLQLMQERYGDLYVCVNDRDDRNCGIDDVLHPTPDERLKFVERYALEDPHYDYISIRL